MHVKLQQANRKPAKVTDPMVKGWAWANSNSNRHQTPRIIPYAWFKWFCVSGVWASPLCLISNWGMRVTPVTRNKILTRTTWLGNHVDSKDMLTHPANLDHEDSYLTNKTIFAFMSQTNKNKRRGTVI